MECAFDQSTPAQFEVSAENRCPECGQPLYPAAVNMNRQPGSSFWLPWVLIAVGLYIVLVFRGQALRDSALLPSSDFQVACSQPPPVRSVNPKLCERFVQDRLLFEHDEAAIAIGGVMLLLGAVRLVRQGLVAFQFSRLAGHAEIAERHNWRRHLAVALGVWTLAENLLFLGLQCLLLIAGATLVVWVANGSPLSVDLMNAALRRAVDAAFVLKLMVS